MVDTSVTRRSCNDDMDSECEDEDGSFDAYVNVAGISERGREDGRGWNLGVEQNWGR